MVSAPGISNFSFCKQIKKSNQNFYPKVANIIEDKIYKVVLTNEQLIKEFNNFIIKPNDNSIQEKILDLRGGDGLKDVAIVFIMAMLMNGMTRSREHRLYSHLL